MATNYPASADDNTTLPNPSSSSATNSPSLAGGQSNQNDAIKALEAKVGTGASTPVISTLMFGTGTGTSAWTALTSAQLRAVLSDETGTGSAVFGTSPTIVTPAIDTISESTPGNGTTINGVQLKSSKMNGSFITDSTVGNTQLAAGVPVQMVSTGYSAVGNGTTLIPIDNTIPQNTEGDQYMTQAITPKSATNILVINAVAFGSHNVTNDVVIALFQDSTANALATNSSYQPTAGGRVTNVLQHTMAAGTTSSTTFKIRIGAQSAGSYTFNGFGGTSLYGTITKSSIVITEYKV